MQALNELNIPEDLFSDAFYNRFIIVHKFSAYSVPDNCANCERLVSQKTRKTINCRAFHLIIAYGSSPIKKACQLIIYLVIKCFKP